MMNIEQITSRLAQMPDQALQQYAMMHKDDPYIMALAVSESRRRKQMRAAAAPRPQAQPKVAEQALMEMAPAGVDALPTQEMDFAGGGIVAFADGGDVERYQTGGSIFAQLDQEKAAQLAQLNAQLAQINPLLIAASQSGDPRAIQQYAQQAQTIRDRINAVRESAGNRIAGIEALMAPAAAPVAAPAAAPAAPAAPTGGISQAALDQGRAPMPGPQLDRGRMGARRSMDEITAEKGLGATPEAAAMRRDTAPASKAPTVQSAQELANQFYDTKAQKAEVEKYVKDQEAAVEKARERRKEGKPEGKAYSKFEEMLQAEEGKAGKERDEATGVAIFKAGLAMMSGTSPRAFENIGKGALTGLEEYTSAMKDLKKSAKERQKAFADIENARRAEERDDWKAKNEFEDKAESRMDNARKYGIDFIKDVTGKSAEIASRIYDRQVSEQGSTDRARMQIAASAAARPYDLQGEYAKALMAGDDKKAASLLQAIQATAAAKRPGLDLTLLKTFEGLPGVKSDLETLNSLRSVPQPKEATLKQIREIEARLLAKAKANNIDPQQIGLSSTSTTGGGQRTIDFNAIP